MDNSYIQSGQRTRPAGGSAQEHDGCFIKDTAEIEKEQHSLCVVSENRIGRAADSGKLIKYILDGGQHKDLNFEKYSHSRNLRQPEVHTRVIPVNNFRANPKPPVRNDGFVYRIEGLYNGFPDLDGFIYQEYVIVKEEQKE